MVKTVCNLVSKDQRGGWWKKEESAWHVFQQAKIRFERSEWRDEAEQWPVVTSGEPKEVPFQPSAS